MDELKIAKQASIVSWPSPQDYNEAVQTPLASFQDTKLAAAEAECDSLGLPRPNTGMFASVYKMNAKNGDAWALRCFLHYIPDQKERYEAIGKELKKQALKGTLDFELQSQGVLVTNKWYPVLKMQWCEGQTLERWLASNSYNREKLQKFLSDWKSLLLSLKNASIAHGDLQHANILVNDDGISLVDYDCMFVPELKGRQSNELGHPAYQHPERSFSHFDEHLDNFSAWLIYLSIEIIMNDPLLWRRFNCGEDSLIFKKKDLDSPQSSRAFYELEKHPNHEIRTAAKTIRYFLGLRPEEIPPLSQAFKFQFELEELQAPGEDESESSSGSKSKCWYEADEFKLELERDPAEPDDREQEPLADQGPFISQSKRRRSRVKGGTGSYHSSQTHVQADASQQDLQAQAKVPQLSPLAELARKVRDQKASPQITETALTESTITEIAFTEPVSEPAQELSPFTNPATTASQNTSGQSSTQKELELQNANTSRKERSFLSFIHSRFKTYFLLMLLAIFVPAAFFWYTQSQKINAVPDADSDNGSYYLKNKDYKRAAAFYQKEIEKLEGSTVLSSEKSRELAIARIGLGDAYYGQNKFAESLTLYQKTVDDLIDNNDTSINKSGDSKELARALGREGKSLEALDRSEEAFGSYSQAVEMYQRLKTMPMLSSDMQEYMKRQARLAGFVRRH